MNKPQTTLPRFDHAAFRLALFMTALTLAQPVLIRPGAAKERLESGDEKARSKGFFDLAAQGEKVGLDLWHYKMPDGRSLRAAAVYQDPRYDVLLEKLPAEAASHRAWLLNWGSR